MKFKYMMIIKNVCIYIINIYIININIKLKFMNKVITNWGGGELTNFFSSIIDFLVFA